MIPPPTPNNPANIPAIVPATKVNKTNPIRLLFIIVSITKTNLTYLKKLAGFITGQSFYQLLNMVGLIIISERNPPQSWDVLELSHKAKGSKI